MSKLFACDFCGKIIQRDEIYTMSITKRYYKPLSESGDSYIGVNSLDERCDLCRYCVQKVKGLKNIEKVEHESDFVIRNFDIFP